MYTPTRTELRRSMTGRPILASLALAAALSACGGGRGAPAAPPDAPWWKGNLHTHSLWSDGDDFPEMITDWYREQGYDFLAISDHNTLAEGEKWVSVRTGSPLMDHYERYVDRFGPDWVEERRSGDTLQVRLRTLGEYRPLLEEPGRFVIIQSEEITSRLEEKRVHMNATNLVEAIPPQEGGTVREVMQNSIDAVRAQRERTGQPMFPHVNHPNYYWSVSVEDLMALEGERFFEVYNGHPRVHNEGDHEHPSTARMWDILLAQRLSAGREVMYGLATDDSHYYGSFTSGGNNPGRGWVMVRAPELTANALVEAMERGDFYSSTGVVLSDIALRDGQLRLEIAADSNVTYRTRFIGTRRGFDSHSEEQRGEDGVVSRRYSDDIGQLLAEVPGASPSYRLRGDEIYVRAQVISSRLKEYGYPEGELETAWTQPVVPTSGDLRP